MKKMLTIAKHIIRLARSRSIMTQGKESTHMQIGSRKNYSSVADYIMDTCSCSSALTKNKAGSKKQRHGLSEMVAI